MHRRLLGLAIACLLVGGAHAQDTYRIGAVNSVTGPLGQFGLSVQKGTELAIDMVGRKVNGRTIVTTWDADGRPVGATVSSFNSVSLTPPLVLFSLACDSAACEVFSSGGPLAIHVLGHEQEALSNRFARGGAEKWADLVYGTGELGSPRLEGALATFECVPYARYPGGDHTIFVCEVRGLRFRDGEPLIFSGGRYRSLASQEAFA